MIHRLLTRREAGQRPGYRAAGGVTAVRAATCGAGEGGRGRQRIDNLHVDRAVGAFITHCDVVGHAVARANRSNRGGFINR